MQITKVVMPQSKYSIKCPYTMVPQGITIHNTYNDASAMSEISYMIGNDKEVSFHEAIDDYRVVQGIEHNRNAWAAGDGSKGFGNRNTIHLEICYSKSGGERFNKAEMNTAKRTAQLMKQYGWGINDLGTKIINTHQYRSGKYCPHRTLDLGIDRFYNLVKVEYLKLTNGENTSTTTSTNSNNTTEGFKVQVTAKELNVRKGPGTNNSINTVVKENEIYTIIETNGSWGKLKSGAGWINLNYTKKLTGSSVSQKTDTTSYTVKVTADVLNVRAGAGTTYKINTTIKKNEVYTIVETKGNWGKLKSGAGWICLDYTRK